MPPKHMDGMSMAGVWRGKYEQTRDQFIIEKHASIISRGSAVTLAKFDKDKQIEGKIGKEIKKMYPRILRKNAD